MSLVSLKRLPAKIVFAPMLKSDLGDERQAEFREIVMGSAAHLSETSSSSSPDCSTMVPVAVEIT